MRSNSTESTYLGPGALWNSAASARILLCHRASLAGAQMVSSADVLVVDDRPLEARTALVAFERVAPRASVLHVMHGAEALGYLFSTGLFASRAPEKPRLVFLSIEMESVSGLCVLELVRAHPLTCEVPVVAVSRARNAHTYRRYTQLDADAYVTLPSDFGRYCAVVEGCVERWLPWALRSHISLTVPYGGWSRRAYGTVSLGETRA